MKKVLTINILFTEGEGNAPSENENIFPIVVEVLEDFLDRACENLNFENVAMTFQCMGTGIDRT